MYDLKINYAFMPHKRVANKQTVGNFGIECLACTGRELQCFQGQLGWHKIIVDRGARQV